MPQNKFRFGIMGGMGPMAGVLLQKLIIENTPAEKDQDHIQVVCFTDPKIPDRTEFLQQGRKSELASAIASSIEVLEKAEVDTVAMTCNTAHACFKEIQDAVSVPMLSIIKITFEKLKELNVSSVGVLATNGTIQSGVFNNENIERDNFCFILAFPDTHSDLLPRHKRVRLIVKNKKVDLEQVPQCYYFKDIDDLKANYFKRFPLSVRE